jgi:hypothetical protein
MVSHYLPTTPTSALAHLPGSTHPPSRFPLPSPELIIKDIEDIRRPRPRPVPIIRKEKKTEQEQATMCIRTITHWLPCCHQRCTSIELCPDAITTLSTTTTPTATRTDGTGAEEAVNVTEAENHVNLFDCSAGGPVFSEWASEEACPVCKVEGKGEVAREEGISVGAGAGVELELELGDDGSGKDDDTEVGLGAEVEDDGDDGSMDGHREAEEAETLAALGWESYFDRCG